MKRAAIAGGLFAIVLVAITVGYRALDRDAGTAAPKATVIAPSTAAAGEESHAGFLYGRITTVVGTTYEGRLRWGGDEEAFWGDYFNGFKEQNPWAAEVPPELLLKEPSPIKIFGLVIVHRERSVGLGRPFMARFGDIALIEAHGRDVRVTLKSGTVFHLDRFEASDSDDDVRVWDAKGVVDLDSLQIRTLELLPAARLGDAPERLHGTVRTKQGDFTGFVQWDREKCVGTDELYGRTPDGYLKLRFDTIRSIARDPQGNSRVTQLDGREVLLSDTREVNQDNRGIYVDDRRYGRVLVAWGVFERLDFSPEGSGPAYGDFPAGSPLTGSVTTRAGQRLAGRLVFDLDESETTETLDAPSQGVNYTIPFGLVASIVPPGREERGDPRARVTLNGGEELRLETTADLGERNGGMLIFVDGAPKPEYVPWADVERVDFDRPPAMYPPLGGR